MKHLKLQSMDKVAANVEKIKKLFPNCVTERITVEGKLEHAIDFDMLKQELSDHVVEGITERYQFTWPDKRRAILAANAPVHKTLRPCREESVDFDNTENLYIEGDNLEVLKLLQETYLGKVKMIYIDPPYNTGNDFVYRDDFKQSAEEYARSSEQIDEEGNRMVTNTESNGRFHTDWLNMMYPRLKLAKDLLSEDGVIIISIDDNELDNQKKIASEIFGEANFVSDVIWQKIHSIKNDAKYFSENHEYGICYAKNIEQIKINLLPRTDEMNLRYKNIDNDSRGPWQSGDLVASGERSNGHYIVISPITGKKFDVPKGKHWVYSQKNLEELIQDNQIWFGSDGNSFPRKKRFLSDVQNGRTPSTLWLAEEVGHNQTATRELKELFDQKKFFDFPKPMQYIKQFTHIFTQNDSLILDFFSGSATTAHAVMQLNAEDGGKRKFIMVQLPEACAEDSEAFKAGYKNICEIGKERIRRAGKKIKEENPLTTQDLDTGFRVLKCDSSNMKDVYYTPKEYMNKQQELFVDNIKQDRSDEDLLFQVMLELDTPLSSKIVKQEMEGKTVYNVAQGHLMACFDENVTEAVITAIAKEQPSYFVMRDSSLANDSVAINFEQIFNTYSPQTERRVL